MLPLWGNYTNTENIVDLNPVIITKSLGHLDSSLKCKDLRPFVLPFFRGIKKILVRKTPMLGLGFQHSPVFEQLFNFNTTYW